MITKQLPLAVILRRTCPTSHQQGLTLVEVIIATIFFGVAVAVVMPGFMNFQTTTISNEGKLGAVAISQQILDQLRRVDPSTLPSAGTSTSMPSGTSTTDMNYLGKQYSAVITYCPSPAPNSPPSPCDANTRQIQVQVSLYGKPIYTVETLFTKFETPS
jgi:type II secretory pathway pseudopilin PulG